MSESQEEEQGNRNFLASLLHFSTNYRIQDLIVIGDFLFRVLNTPEDKNLIYTTNFEPFLKNKEKLERKIKGLKIQSTDEKENKQKKQDKRDKSTKEEENKPIESEGKNLPRYTS